MSSDALVGALEALGFTLNEARAYVALLGRGPSTGYEVGQAAAVPRSAVYGVLRRLVDRGAARSVPARDGEPERFVAVAADALATLLRKRFEAQSNTVEQLARELAAPPPPPEAFTVRGYPRILEEAERLVSGATAKVLVSGWPRELASLSAAIERAVKRGVFAVVFTHAAPPAGLAGEIFTHGLREADLEGFWKHRLVVVVDDARTLVGAVERSPEDAAVLSGTAAIAELATSQIALDITLLTQRRKEDVSALMGRMLGDRVGRLDALLPTGEATESG
jgi:sugar-specific transcriptional regulator TrmB